MNPWLLTYQLNMIPKVSVNIKVLQGLCPMLGNNYSCIVSSCLTAYSGSIMARSGMEASLVLVHKFALLPRSVIPVFFKNVLFGSTLRPFYPPSHPPPLKHSHNLSPFPENRRHLVKTQTLVTRFPSPVTSHGSMSSHPHPAQHDRIRRGLGSVHPSLNP